MNQTFSYQVKKELEKVRVDGKSLEKVLLSGIVKSCGSITLPVIGLKIQSEHDGVIRIASKLLKSIFKAEIIEEGMGQVFSREVCIIKVEKAEKILEDLEILKSRDIVKDLPSEAMHDENLLRLYLRGLFLGGGSITSPEKSYHLEIVLSDTEIAEKVVIAVDKKFEIAFGTIERKDSIVLYLKGKDKIVDFLKIIGANMSLFEYEDQIIIKQTKNHVNRTVNCETANISRTAEASFNQIKAIKKLQEDGRLGMLNDKLLEIAMLRLEFPDLSLTELGEQLTPKLGKSGVNHRLAKIVEIADQI